MKRISSKKRTATTTKSSEIKYQKKLKNESAEEQTKLQLFRPILIETIAAGYPHFLTVGLILAISHIKTPQQISMTALDELLQQLVAEGMIIMSPSEPCLKSNRYRFNEIHTGLIKFELSKDGKIYCFSDKELRSILMSETEHEKRIRLIKRRTNTFYQRHTVFDDDLKSLYTVLPDTFTFDEVLSVLPEEWKTDHRRNTTHYLNQCLIVLEMFSYVERSEITGLDYTKIQKAIGY
jgi:hypothetical protein